MRAFKDCVAFGILNKYLRLEQLRTTDPELASLDPFSQYRKQFGQSVLHSMCFNDRVEMLEYFLTHKLLNIDETDKEGCRPVHIATIKSITTGSIQTLKVLVEHGADLLLKEASGKTICDFIVERDPEQQLEVTKYLIEQFDQQRSTQLKEVFYCIMNTEGRMKPPLCFFSDLTLYGVLDLL